MKILFLAAIAIAVCFTANGQQELSENEKQSIRKECSTVLQEVFRKIKEKGYTAELEFLHNSPDFFWIPPGQSLPVSYDSVARIIRKFMPGNRSVESVWDTLYIQPLSRDVASYTGTFYSVYTDTSGKVSRYTMHEIGLLMKKKGIWKLVSGKTSVLADK